MVEFDTGQIRDRLLIRLRECKTVVFVTHKGTDSDNAASIYLMKRAIQRLSPEMAFEFSFVNPGTLISGPFPTETLVIHLDTGGRFDLENFVFDHHTPDCPFLSATDIVFSIFFPERLPKYLSNLVELVNRVDTGNETDTLTAEDYQALADANEMLTRDDGTPIGRFVRHTLGPSWLVELCKNRPPRTSDMTHMLFILRALDCYAEKFRRLFENSELFARSNIVLSNGVRFAFIPPSRVDPADLRGYLNGFHHSEVDVMVTECLGDAATTQGQFTVALLSKKRDHPGVRGIKRLAERLREIDPEADVFCHFKEWLIYVKPGSEKLTLTVIFEMAKETLYTEEFVAVATSFGGAAAMIATGT